jgi:hypothetical protein
MEQKGLIIKRPVTYLTALATNKMSLIELSSDLMPKGKPDFKQITAARTIENLLLTKEIEKRSEVRNLLAALIRDFCAAFNFAQGKNLNEVQTVEVACIYLDEVDDYSIEDFVMMFSMAKRGLIKDDGKDVIFDRIDIPILLRIKALYNKIRWEEWDRMNEEELRKKEGTYVEPEKGNTNRWPEVLAHFKEKVAEGKKEREDLKEERHRNFISNRETMIRKLAEEAKENGDTLLEQHYLSQL